MFLKRQLIVFALFLLCVSSISGPAQPPVGCQRRVTTVNVLDHEGNVITGLGTTAFRAESGGRPLKVLSNFEANPSRRVVIMVDVSGSTINTGDLARLLAGSLATSERKFRTAVVLFSEQIVASVDFTRPTEDVLNMLTKLPENKGRTALFDALKYAADLFGPPLPGDSVYLISDGGENRSKAKPGDIENELLTKGIRIYSFNLAGNRVFSTEEERQGPALLKDLASLTGGMALDLEMNSSKASRERVAAKLQRLYREMTDFYVLQIEPSAEFRKPQRWDLELLDSQGRKRQDVRLIYPRKLAPCLSH